MSIIDTVRVCVCVCVCVFCEHQIFSTYTCIDEQDYMYNTVTAVYTKLTHRSYSSR